MLRNAMRVLRLFSTGRREISMTEVARLLNRAPSTASRWLRAMTDAGFLERDATSGRYSVGVALAAVGELADQASPLQRVGRAALHRLTSATGETTYIGVLKGAVAVLTDGVASPQPIALAFTVGEHVALHATAVGKCLLAWQPTAVVRRLVGNRRRLPAATPHTITDVDRFLAALAGVRDRGFATARLEWEHDLAAAAAPIRNHVGDVVAALSVGGPASRISRGRLDEIGRLAVFHAEQASAELGFASLDHATARRSRGRPARTREG